MHRLDTRFALRAVAVLALGHLVLGRVVPPQSHFLVPDELSIMTTLGWLVRLAFAVGAALCFIFGPGLVLRRFVRPSSLWSNTAFVWIPGLVYLTMLGFVAWVLAPGIPPVALMSVAVAPLPVGLWWVTSDREDIKRIIQPDERIVCIVVLLLLAIGVGKATWSPGPEGELYGGSISRTLEPGDRSDPRIPFIIVELAAHGEGPYSDPARALYAPYSFDARGPIAGLASVPVVLSGNASPPLIAPDDPWEPFDAQGYATYRIVLMLLGATVVLAVFGLLRRLLSAKAAQAGMVLVALAPYVVHEVYFTWPKLLAAALVICSLLLLLERRPFIAGGVAGLAALAHPLALFAVPAIVLGWLVLRNRPALSPCPALDDLAEQHWFKRWAVDLSWFGLGLGILYGAWMLVNLGHSRDYFTEYFVTVSDGRTNVDLGTWLSYRARSLANTFVPFRLFLAESTHPEINFPGATNLFAGVTRFSTQYRLTIPFAVGFFYFPVYVYGLVRVVRRAAPLIIATLVIPLAFFTVYWGATSSGLGEAIQFFVVLSLILAFIGHSVRSPGGRWPRIVQICATARVAEVAFVVLVPTIVTDAWIGPDVFALTDVVAMFTMAVGMLGLGWISWKSFGALIPARESEQSPVEPSALAGA